MKQRLLNKIIVGLTTILMLVSCGKNLPSKPDPAPVNEDPESILKDLDFKPTAPINLDDRAYYYNDHYNQVEPNFRLKLEANSEIGELQQHQVFANVSSQQFIEGIHIKSNKGHHVDFTCSVDSQTNTCEIIPANEVFAPGLIYTCIVDNTAICFFNKSPTIRKVFFDVKREDSNVYQISKDLKYFDCSKVLKEAPQDMTEIEDPQSEEAKQWFENTTYELIYANNDFSKLNEGDNFAICPFKGGHPVLDDKNSNFYKFVKNEKIDEGYKVTYKNVDLHEIYKDENGNEALDVYINEQKVKEFGEVALKFDKDEFAETLRSDRNYRRLIDAAIIATGRENAVTVYDVLTHIQIVPTFSWSAPKFVFQLEAGVFFPINDEGTSSIKISVIYQYISELSAAASYEIETFLGIPYWISAKGALTQTITNKVTVDIALMRSFTPEEQDTSDMKKMCKEAYEKLENDPAYFMDKTDDDYCTSGNDRLVPICAINFPFGYIFSFYIELDIHLVMDFRIMFEYNYVNTYTERVLNFTTDDGVENTANTESISAYSHSIELLGELGYSIGAQIRVGLCITGLEKLFGLGVYVEGGFYFDLKGMVGITWGSEDDDVRFIGGVDFDFGLYGVVAGFLDFLVVHPKYEFAKGKLSLFGYYKPYSVIDLMSPDTIDLDHRVTPLETTNLLMTKVFSIEEMKVDLIVFKPDDEVEVITPLEGSSMINPIHVEDDSEYLEIKDNNIVISDKSPTAFTAHITLTVDESLTYLLDGEPLTKTVTVNFKSKDAHSVSIKGVSNTITSEKGRYFTLPKLTHVAGMNDKTECELKYDGDFNIISDGFKYDAEYYDFICFTDGTNDYYPSLDGTFTQIEIKDKDVVLTPVLKEIVYHTATFYNGKGEVIKQSRVREFTDAVEPTMEEIMAGMEGYTFYGWDRDFSNLGEDIEVRGIYYKLGE